ncbi:Multidrug resistance efflux pump [Cohaesibacter sp. ES.047]|uniref:HlyD family secretion protein n=1 Tax=Cohaesibacter sp. ES.047 TaxID=1798205 RepID=UPI000BB99920|nr:HlyD family efflux transporter periplasmic adaptor subunit [Cohaesibacter sp. ES.047]SNY91334.1 Multidrug resistance efflux pump [Cohaesibacter sp. ES.047]
MRSLKKRPRSDNLVNQSRRHSGSLGRRIYLGLLIVFVFFVANYFWGDLIFLRGDGLVMRDKTVIAASYVSRIDEVAVTPGAVVSEGEEILHIASPEQLERLADLSTRQADLIQRSAEFRLRKQIADRMLPLAKERQQKTGELLDMVGGLKSSGNLSNERYHDILAESFDASSQLARLMADQDTLSDQMASLETARTEAHMALKNLQDHYSQGVIRSPVTGTVGAHVPVPGSVYRSGDPMVSIFSGDAYVLTYLPRRYLFAIEVGMEVNVSSGRQSVAGVIDAILPVSDMLPQEFQSNFKPRERSQLARIRLVEPDQFPLYEKVSVSSRLMW